MFLFNLNDLKGTILLSNFSSVEVTNMSFFLDNHKTCYSVSTKMKEIHTIKLYSVLCI